MLRQPQAGRPVNGPPVLFDRNRLARQRARAAGSPASAWFLHREAASQVGERLAEINRTFYRPAIVGWRSDPWRHWIGLPEACCCLSHAGMLADTDARHDLIIHALSLHWENDPVGELIQSRRALCPDGFLVAVLLGGRTLHELRTALAHAESEVEGGLSPRVAPMGDVRDLGNLLPRAGLALPVADSIEIRTSYESPLKLMHDLRAMGETNALSARRRTGLRRATLAAAVDHYREHFPAESGRVSATFELIFLSGWAAHDRQPKPLRPGSATRRLADALGTVEHGPDPARSSRLDLKDRQR
ncbi:MAG: SAM-dependent methyltransferase [Paracoccaceae bacterium]|nr:SAM-dependent methyltransferase [Paracoccaceae bacterium]